MKRQKQSAKAGPEISDANTSTMSDAEMSAFLARANPPEYSWWRLDKDSDYRSVLTDDELRCFDALWEGRRQRSEWMQKHYKTLLEIRATWQTRHPRRWYRTHPKWLRSTARLYGRPTPTFPLLPPLMPSDRFAVIREQIRELEHDIAQCARVEASPYARSRLADTIAAEIEEKEKEKVSKEEARAWWQQHYSSVEDLLNSSPESKDERRIRLLRAKANDPGVTKAEAAAFAVKADELATRKRADNRRQKEAMS